MTILVKSNHKMDEYTHIASKLMSYDSVYAEQVGFVETPVNSKADAHLQMAGGEFCGNACMALAAFITTERGIGQNDSTEIVLEVSGVDELITCSVKRKSNGFYCRVVMPIPQIIEERTIQYEGNELDIIIVRYPDFIHIVIEVDEFTASIRNKAESFAKLLGLTCGANLIGILLYKAKNREMAPLIYVPHLDSMVWERGCGSGTASIGVYLAWKHKEKIVAEIKQPGGVIQVNADYHEQELTGLHIEGVVGIVAQGKAFIDIYDYIA
ncbi:diaminopimelate epimerase [Paenibacillus qinlingensis]|uniref:diaminopimelate epimerase n=1 Tax=Paenibacillus qinlingensis TaxID=1837343 RepID=UPI0015672DA8|nr:diaminopimelate epimerase [Paenibacillus qinlingensis]NQX57991.1 diaminopimelate epimerase [Paenibacillus qinlingensis]